MKQDFVIKFQFKTCSRVIQVGNIKYSTHDATLDTLRQARNM